MTKLAKINFYKDVEQDHYEEGCTGPLQSIWFEQISIEFDTQQDLLKSLATWLDARYDVNVDEYLQHTTNECDHYRFDFMQNESVNGFKIELSAEKPTGYLAHYQMLITEVLEINKIDYTFDQLGEY